MIRILTASAGSGKTYTLAKTYVDLLLSSDDPFAYRHILAVTFTNKATTEMKERILRMLKERSATDPRAGKLLGRILHDYSAFAVSTIDKFFQQALRSFSRELGQMAQYQIELDRNSLITEAMDRILDSLTPDRKDLLGWLEDDIEDKLSRGEKPSFEKNLHDMGLLLKSESHRKMAEEAGIRDCDAFPKEKLAVIRRACREIVTAYHDRVKSAAIALEPEIKGAVARRGVLKYAAGYRPWEVVELPNKTVTGAIEGTELGELLFSDAFKVYNTARMLDRQAFSLGLAQEFYTEFDALLKERNLMCLDESNTILRDIIDGSDAPFVYEKLGVRFENFLLDEFQDTSGIQWENFLPLLKESESKGADCLIVGDVKQSIYRFRDSDWKLLDEKVPAAFDSPQVDSLKCNWRSARAIVDFNNGFFESAARELSLSRIYDTVRQEYHAKDEPQTGEVKLTFTDDQTQAVLESVRAALSQGAGPGDIAVLVRGHSEGGLVAEALIGEGYRVISDDSLALKSSLAVRRVIAVLTTIEKPSDGISRYIAGAFSDCAPQGSHSLVDLCEEILRSIAAVESLEGETLFIQALLDDVQKFAGTHGNNLRLYLRHWEESNLFIASPDDNTAIRVITIHKSKGLEFPYVIFPFADKVDITNSKETRWCRLHTAGTPLPPEAEGIYPVLMSSAAADTLFAEQYDEEMGLQRVDNLNVFYVALTRASKTLHVIAKTPPEKPDKGPKNMSQLLYKYCGGFSEYRKGEPYDFTKMKREESTDELFEGRFESFPVNPDPSHPRLIASDDAFDFFGDEGVGTQVSARLTGIVLHSILSAVRVPSDLGKAVADAVAQGLITAEEGEQDYAFLKERIAAHAEWFPEDARALHNETEILSDDGRYLRPDRVVETSDGRTVVIDYKFGGRKESYDRQIEEYVSLYRKMGRTEVEGHVWYVREG